MLMMMVLVMVLVSQLCQFLGQCGLAFHGLQQLLTGQFIPGSGDDGGIGIVLPQHLHSLIQLGLRNGIGTGQDDGGCGLHLVVVEFTEVLHIDLHLAGIHHSNGIAQGHIVGGNLFHSTDDIGQLAYTGRFDDNPVGMVLIYDLGQSLAEITHQTAADAAGVHFGNIDTRVLEETAVDADLTKFIFDKN